jgi:hypothetical protein
MSNLWKIPDTVKSIGGELLITKKKTSRYTKKDVIEVLELLENQKLHAQEIAKQSNFSATQIKKLRYIKKHMTEVEQQVLLEAKYYISSIKRYIRARISKQRKTEKIFNKKNKHSKEK